MGVDLRNKYRIGGNQPGEPREPRELGVDTPLDGLYLREDVEIVCNMALASFVKKETIEATGKMIERLARKAELLDEGKLHAMFENGKLRTAKPSVFTDEEREIMNGSNSGSSPPGSPGSSVSAMNFGPRLDQKGYGRYHDVVRTPSQSRSSSQQGLHYSPAFQQQGYNGPDGNKARQSNMPIITELQGSEPALNLFGSPLHPQGQVFRSELPGDSSFSSHNPSPQPSPRFQQSQAVAGAATGAGDDRKGSFQYQAYAPPPEIPARSVNRNSIVPTSNNHAAISDWQRSTLTAMGNQHLQNGDDMSSQYTEGSTVSGRDSMMTGVTTPEPQHAKTGSSAVVTKCPVCDLFEGDEAAVTHHVSKSHFS